MDTSLSLVLMSNPQELEEINTDTQMEPNTHIGQKGRKPGGNRSSQPKKKKTPQRGMGVAQLERLRLQERWKTVLESSNQIEHSLSGTPSPSPSHQLQMFNMLQLPPPQATPLQYGHGYYYHGVPVIAGNNGNGLPDLSYQGGSKMLGSAEYSSDYYCSAGSSPTSFETSRELSSMPNIKKQQNDSHGHCDVCLQMKFKEGKKHGCQGVGDSSLQNAACWSFGFSGQENYQTSAASIGDKIEFSGRAARSAFNVNNNVNPGNVESIFIQSKEDMYSEERTIKEYEFFPGLNSGRIQDSETKLASSGIAAAAFGGGEANSCITTSENHSGGNGASNASSLLDLSLKLSC